MTISGSNFASSQQNYLRFCLIIRLDLTVLSDIPVRAGDQDGNATEIRNENVESPNTSYSPVHTHITTCTNTNHSSNPSSNLIYPTWPPLSPILPHNDTTHDHMDDTYLHTPNDHLLDELTLNITILNETYIPYKLHKFE